jgi:hypothetical protein
MMRRVVAWAFLINLVVAGTAAAQLKFEASVFGGYTWAEGVKGKDFLADNGQIYNGASSSNSGSFGLSFGVAEGHGEYGFLYRRQFGQFQVSGTTTTKIGDMATDNYHGYLTYYLGDPKGKVHFYLSGGVGMTHFAAVTFVSTAGSTVTLAGRSEFSPTFGAGVRVMANGHLGFRAGVQWTPIYLTVDQDSMWCDPYYGCYLQGNPQYANQVDFLGGVTFRFGGK